jgi:hypothetical protein
MSGVLNLIVTHQPSDAVARMTQHWNQCVAPDSILIAYGGPRKEFDFVHNRQKIFIDDPRLRTRDHQRELQSYTGLFRTAARWLDVNGRDFQFVHFAEYDHVPLVNDLNTRQIERLKSERADVLGFGLGRIDDTNQPHFLYHINNPEFTCFWRRITRRADPEVVLSIFGSGSFWTREAFCAVALAEEPFPMYTEIYLPTMAHHLGFRVRDFGDQDRFARELGDATDDINDARAEGAWTLHPVKHLWTN